ncbi:immunoglobulin lambda-1 light chain-like [Pteronotus mesoamericanus]|uniref:immunoglobulin lambda-1 light chain-like n=1 Tax=Pteronotus mesoamericanus TaxID=1884717 RepID=UPI0023EC449C|nr:immunoglobulin lambda-1 light chain-like [Pteronotus parnellii mesoamericanus]
MAWTVLLLGLLAHSSGVDSQTAVTQEPSLSVSSGGTVTLTCGLSSGSVTSGNYPSWYQQTPGKAPRQLIYNTNSRPSGVPERFSGSISGNKAALTISGAQPEDEADYYCALNTGSNTYTAVVTQEASLSTTPGGTVTLTCGSSAGAVTTSNYASWVQQKPSQTPKALVGGTSSRVPGVPARFSGSLLGNKAALTITGAQPEDEAEYYCALWHSNYFHSDRCRRGTAQPGTSGSDSYKGQQQIVAHQSPTKHFLIYS